MITRKVKRWVRHTACNHYCANWDMTGYSVVERLQFSHKKSLHPRQSTLKMDAPVVSRIMVPVYHVTWHHMPRRHDTESRPWEPQIYVATMWLYARHTRPVQKKVSDLWLGKIRLHVWRSATLTPFKAVYLWLNTRLPAVPPLFEAFLERLFVNGVQFAHRVSCNVVLWLKFSPFRPRF